MRRPGKLTVLTIVAATLLLASWLLRGTLFPPQLITTTGRFASHSGSYRVRIEEFPAALRYTVFRTADSAQLTINFGSDYHRRFCTWDEGDRLWIYSSDVGSCVFVPDGDPGRFVEAGTEEFARLEQTAPDVYWDNVATALKTRRPSR
jgi:hypothetical protein